MIGENPICGQPVCSVPTRRFTRAAKISDSNQQVAWRGRQEAFRWQMKADFLCGVWCDHQKPGNSCKNKLGKNNTLY